MEGEGQRKNKLLWCWVPAGFGFRRWGRYMNWEVWAIFFRSFLTTRKDNAGTESLTQYGLILVQCEPSKQSMSVSDILVITDVAPTPTAVTWRHCAGWQNFNDRKLKLRYFRNKYYGSGRKREPILLRHQTWWDGRKQYSVRFWMPRGWKQWGISLFRQVRLCLTWSIPWCFGFRNHPSLVTRNRMDCS